MTTELPPLRPDRCETCRFWDAFRDRFEGEGAFAECRRYPPIAKTAEDTEPSFFAGFPVTTQSDWCGEWQPQPGGASS